MNSYAQTARIFKALSDENRVRILEILKSGEKCACKLLEELNVTQPTLSHHMKILCDSGIVDSRKDGKWTYYRISKSGRDNAMRIFAELTEITGGDDEPGHR
ncbi:MAG: winged helix-turn-helix transcriptional regulator [Oscillospiraceae bacterium]|nr:winged helix-turn-helix transcriptional regulator [Oscillospiraceae bacterium]